MKIIYKHKGVGKTMELLTLADKTENSVVVVPYGINKKKLCLLIKKMRFDINHVITFYDYIHRKTPCHAKANYFFDDIDMCLQSQTHGNIKMITATKENKEKRCYIQN